METQDPSPPSFFGEELGRGIRLFMSLRLHPEGYKKSNVVAASLNHFKFFFNLGVYGRPDCCV